MEVHAPSSFEEGQNYMRFLPRLERGIRRLSPRLCQQSVRGTRDRFDLDHIIIGLTVGGFTAAVRVAPNPFTPQFLEERSDLSLVDLASALVVGTPALSGCPVLATRQVC